MQISPTMDLAQLTELIGYRSVSPKAIAEAENMRVMLSAKYPGQMTEDVPGAEWQLLCIGADPDNEPTDSEGRSMTTITATEVVPGQKIVFRKNGQTVTAVVVSSKPRGELLALELACDSENIRKLTSDERSAPTVRDWFESFPKTARMTLVS